MEISDKSMVAYSPIWLLRRCLHFRNAAIDVSERCGELRLTRLVRGVLELAGQFLPGKLQGFDLLRLLRILDRGFTRLRAIMLELFHALLDSSFVID
jgi:hypothetical protein